MLPSKKKKQKKLWDYYGLFGLHTNNKNFGGPTISKRKCLFNLAIKKHFKMKARIYSHYIIHVFPYPRGGISSAMREGPELQKGKGFVSRILISADVILAASVHLVELLAGNEPAAGINSIKGKHGSG